MQVETEVGDYGGMYCVEFEENSKWLFFGDIILINIFVSKRKQGGTRKHREVHKSNNPRYAACLGTVRRPSGKNGCTHIQFTRIHPESHQSYATCGRYSLGLAGREFKGPFGWARQPPATPRMGVRLPKMTGLRFERPIATFEGQECIYVT